MDRLSAKLKRLFNYTEIALKMDLTPPIGATGNSKFLLMSPQTREAFLPMILRNVPDWESDSAIWAFEAPFNLLLFAENSRLPIRFIAGTVIVMRDLFPIKAFPVIEASR